MASTVGACQLSGPQGQDTQRFSSGYRGGALIDTAGFFGRKARDTAMSRVSEVLDLESETGRRPGTQREEKTPHTSLNAQCLVPWGRCLAAVVPSGCIVWVTMRGRIMSARGRSWGLPAGLMISRISGLRCGYSQLHHDVMLPVFSEGAL